MKKPDSAELDLLQRLGLTRTQALLYATAVRRGTASVLELARQTKISRQQVYRDADILVEMGLFDATRKERRKYVPASPATLLLLAERRAEEDARTRRLLESLVPRLESVEAVKRTAAKVSYFEGLTQIKEAYRRELAAAKGTEVLSLVGDIEETFAYFPEDFWKKWNAKFVKQQSSSRMLVAPSIEATETARFDAQYHRETRAVDGLSLRMNIDIFGATVLIVSFQDELAFWIDSAVLADSYRALFETLWRSGLSAGRVATK